MLGHRHQNNDDFNSIAHWVAVYVILFYWIYVHVSYWARGRISVHMYVRSSLFTCVEIIIVLTKAQSHLLLSTHTQYCILQFRFSNFAQANEHLELIQPIKVNPNMSVSTSGLRKLKIMQFGNIHAEWQRYVTAGSRCPVWKRSHDQKIPYVVI